MDVRIERATVIGDGAMGTVCALILAQRQTDVTLWGRSPEHVETIQKQRENRRYLPGHKLPDSIKVVHDPGAAFDRPSVIVSAVPCQHVRSIWQQLAGKCPRDVPIVSVAKGIENKTLILPTAIIRECLGQAPLACLSGPSIAPEVAGEKPTGVVVAADSTSVAELVQAGLSTPYFRIYTSDDLIGVELAGAVKNVIALAAGLCDGIGAGDNAKASLLTRGLVEITRLGKAMGASDGTFRGLAGVGDLFTTCVSKIGRNRSAGERIGRGENVEQVIASTDSVIEGIPTTKSVLQLAENHHVELPIVAAVAAVLFDEQSPAEAIHGLMTRPLRSE